MSFAEKGLWIILVLNPLGTVSSVIEHMPFLPVYSVSLLFSAKSLTQRMYHEKLKSIFLCENIGVVSTLAALLGQWLISPLQARYF